MDRKLLRYGAVCACILAALCIGWLAGTKHAATEKQSVELTNEPASVSYTEEEMAQIGEAVFAAFPQYMDANGFIQVDVSDMNQEMYPGAKVLQAGDGTCEFYIISGTTDDADNFWFFYYNDALHNAEAGDFLQKYVPEDMSQPRSVAATVNGVYFRSDIIGGVAIVGSAQPELAGYIDQVFTELGVPENNNIVI